MNILFIAPYIPYPLSEGGKISQYAVIDCLRKMHRITLLLVSNSKEDNENIKNLVALWPEVEIITINLCENEIQENKTILFIILNKLKIVKKNIENKFLKRSINTSEAINIDPHFANISFIKDSFLINEIAKLLSTKFFNIVQVDLIEYADLAYLIPTSVKKVFVHHEIRYARILTTFKAQKIEFDQYSQYVIDYVKGKEKQLLQLYDAIFVFSEDDKQKLKLEISTTDIYVTPFPILENNFIEITENNAVINKIVFVGGEEHKPNKDAVEWYIEEIMQYVVTSSHLKFHVIGKWTNETIIKYRENKNVIFEGFVDDLVAFCKNSIMVVPVRIGSGIRTKILYAMAQGVPIVSATIGCEGIGAVDSKEILIADDAQSFANAIFRLKSDKNLILRLVNNAQNLVRKNYSQETVGQLRSKYFEEICSNK